MLNEMVKNANCSLAERVKIAAAVVAMHNYDRTQDILEAAGEMKKTAALRGIDLPDGVAVQAAAESFAELDQAKYASAFGDRMSKIWEGTKNIARKPGVRIPALGLAGAGVGAGGAALAGEEDAKILALAGLLGGGAGAFMGAKPDEVARLREMLKFKGKKAAAGAARV